MKIKCIGDRCKYYQDPIKDRPGYCGLINVVNGILKIANLPKLQYVFWFTDDFSVCPFDDFDISKINNLDYVAVYDLNKSIKENFYINPVDYVKTIDSFKGGSTE